MAKISFPGLAEYELMLSRLGNQSSEIAKKAVYAGAEIIADEIKKNIAALKAETDQAGLIAYVKKEPAPLTETAKKGLLDGLGISGMQDDNGYVNVKIGFDGYNDMKTQKYPKGQPNVVIARVVESGSSIAEKRPFVRPAINKKKKEAEAAMAAVLDQEIKKIMK